ncbi:MAG: hypothetical protein CVU77_09160 [Elusimicrobia bacterium HGW-Elusimicrobia-1]|jgi:hypothetical protein|nr:MAG: hypothetical protein CVU77_09160 [Elusimicrobia bacterium HGW-Elusimicrobia-1]
MKRRAFINIVFPAAHLAGRLLPSLRGCIERKVVEINNKLTCDSLRGKRAASVLLLLPHCLQLDSCPHKITSDILNCRACGKCDVAGILSLEGKYGIIIKVATGGRLAKKWVEESGADIILAVACERELVEGITAVWPARVLAVENSQPEGPCVNTRVDVSRLSGALEELLKTERT